MKNDLEILYHDECQVLDWGESRTAGPWIKLKLSSQDGDPLDAFRGLDTPSAKRSGHILNVTVAMGDIAALAQDAGKPEKLTAEPVARAAKGPYGYASAQLHAKGFFQAPPVYQALGDEQSYKDYVQRQPCAVCGGQDWVEDIGEGRCEYAHVRRAGTSGQAYRAPYWALPLCHACHQHQHQHGEADLLNARIGQFCAESAGQWFNEKRAECLAEWGHRQLNALFDVPSLTCLDPMRLHAWCEVRGLVAFLPRACRPPAAHDEKLAASRDR